MEINISNNDNTKVFNQDTIVYYSNKDIIKVNTDITRSEVIITALYAGIYSFNDAERYVFKRILTGKVSNATSLIKVASSFLGKSNITIKRAIKSLEEKRLIRVLNNGEIKLHDKVNVTADDLDKAKCLLITCAPYIK